MTWPQFSTHDSSHEIRPTFLISNKDNLPFVESFYMWTQTTLRWRIPISQQSPCGTFAWTNSKFSHKWSTCSHVAVKQVRLRARVCTCVCIRGLFVTHALFPRAQKILEVWTHRDKLQKDTNISLLHDLLTVNSPMSTHIFEPSSQPLKNRSVTVNLFRNKARY